MAAKRKSISRMHFKRGINFEKFFGDLLGAWGARGLEIGCMPFSSDAAIEIGTAKDGKSGSLTVPVTYGFMARLPFVEQDKAAQWEELYEADVKKAVAAHGSDYDAWQFTPGGSCGILVTVPPKNDGQILATGICVVEDKEGNPVGRFHLFRGSGLPGAAALEDIKAESIEELVSDAAAALTSPALSANTPAWSMLKFLFDIVFEYLASFSDWSLRELHQGKEHAAWILTPNETANASTELEEQLENILGTLAHPVFPRREAVFVMTCVCGKDAARLGIDGPFSIEPNSLAAECELYRLAENPGQKSLFVREINLNEMLTSCVDEKSSIFEQAKGLANDISDALGIIRAYPEDFGLDDENDFEEDDSEVKDTKE